MISGRPRRWLALLGAASAGAAAIAGGTAVAPPAMAVAAPATASAGACTDPDGVTVVVDFGSLGGGLKVRCAAWPVSNGFDALKKAGFTSEGTSSYPGLLCRIDGKPTAAQDPCHNAPPPKSYWGYWHAARGGEWRYSTSGAGSYRPKKGSVEGWAFGDSPTPGIAPPAPLPSPPTSTTRPPTTTTARPAGGAAAGSTPTTSAGAGGAAATTTIPTVATVAGDPSTTTTAAAAARLDATASDDATEAAADPPAGEDDAGSPVGVLVAGVLVVALGGAAGWFAQRRARERRAS